MERNFVDEATARTTFADSSWTKSPIVGSQLPDGEYDLGALAVQTFNDQDGTERKYPTMQVEGHGTISGRSIIGSTVVLPIDKAVVKSNRTGGYYIQSEPFNKQFSGIPIDALVALQGKRVALKSVPIKVQTQFPEAGTIWDEITPANEAYNNLASKKGYVIKVVGQASYLKTEKE